MRDVFDELKALIDYIQSAYSTVTDEWLADSRGKVNLKKLRFLILMKMGPFTSLLQNMFSC